MKLLIILDKTFSNEYSLKYEDLLIRKADELKNIFSAELQVIEKGVLNTNSPIEYIESMYEIVKEYTDILYLRADSPLINIEETKKLLDAHNKAMAYYTYGENYPKGIVPTVIRVGAFERLLQILKGKDIKLNYSLIDNAVFIDPNFFEIEVIISETDMRYYRLDFHADSKRNTILIDNFINYEGYKSLVESIKANHNLRRTLPAYFEIDITGSNNVGKVNSPVDNNEDIMSLDGFKKLYESIKNFTDDFHLSIGSFYEPMLNDNWYSVLEYALKYNKANIYFETNALLLNEENAKKLLSLQETYNNLHVLFHLDAVDENAYNKIYVDGNLKTILLNLEYYLLRRVKNVYMYIIKQKDNFDYLAQYYKYFEKYKVSIIMQKYSTFRNTLKDNRVGDMKPLIFVGCSHLLRDLYIDALGNVPICKYDNKKTIMLGNIFEKGIEHIWQDGYKYYADNVERRLDFCTDCDDWYLYNF